MSSLSLDTAERHDDIEGIDPPAATPVLFGHEEAWRDLMSAAGGSRMHHAWLFQGPKGIGKATTAFAFARFLLAHREIPPIPSGGAPLILPDDAAASQIASGSHPGLVHLTRPPAERGTGFRLQITVEEIRRLSHFFQRTAGDAWRIAIIDPADDMNRNAANALLKILEEPPARALFLLTNHFPGRLLPTIRSRCRILRFAPLEPQAVGRAVLRALPDTPAADARKAAERSDGSLRTAYLSILAGGLEVAQRLEALYRARQPDWSAIHAMLDALVQRGRETAFDLMVADLFSALVQESKERLLAGDARGAERLAALWQREDARFREAAAFNLDRKQTLLTFFRNLAEARR